MKQSFLFKPFGVSLILTLLLAAGMFLGGADFLREMELQQLDDRFAFREMTPKPFPKNIVLVEVNNRSVHFEKRWPWDWGKVASMIETIRKAGPKVIALEIPLLHRPDV